MSIATFLTILFFKIDFNQDIDIDYEFKNWKYATTQFNFVENALLTSECIDSNAETIFADTKFFKT